METYPGYPAVIYFRNRLEEYYMIDLESLPEKLSPITDFTAEKMKAKAVEDMTGWTVIDNCIYCIGGLKEEKGNYIFTVGMNLHKYNTTNPNSTWELILPQRNLRWYTPFVFAFGRKIYVISANKLIPAGDECENPNWTYGGEYYNLDSQTWSYLPNLTHINNIESCKAAAVDETTIVFYSVCTGLLLLYDLEKENLIHEEELHHPDLNLAESNRFKQYAGSETLFYIANYVEAVVCDSTLYWLNNDLCLYGYDYVRKEWFQSNSLKLSWSLSLDPHYLVYAPRLFCLNDDTFVAICHVTLEELGMAIIEVKKEPPSLNVSLKFSHKFPVDTSDSGMAISQGVVLGRCSLPLFCSFISSNLCIHEMVFDMDGQRELFPLLSPTLAQSVIWSLFLPLLESWKDQGSMLGKRKYQGSMLGKRKSASQD